jgi:hypothetical protein
MQQARPSGRSHPVAEGKARIAETQKSPTKHTTNSQKLWLWWIASTFLRLEATTERSLRLDRILKATHSLLNSFSGQGSAESKKVVRPYCCLCRVVTEGVESTFTIVVYNSVFRVPSFTSFSFERVYNIGKLWVFVVILWKRFVQTVDSCNFCVCNHS